MVAGGVIPVDALLSSTDIVPVASQPMLPWLALGVVLGAMSPRALGFVLHQNWSPAWVWWLIGLPIAVGATMLMTRMPMAARCLVFAAACLLGGALAAPTTPSAPIYTSDEHSAAVVADDVPQRLIELNGTVTSVRWRGWSQGFALTTEQVLMPADYRASSRLFVHAPLAPEVRCGDRVTVRGLWSRGDRGDQVQAVSLFILQARENGTRGWAWKALERVAEHRELAEAYIIGQGDPPEKTVFKRAGLLHILAVSGSHLAIAAAFGAWMLRLFGLGWGLRQVALAALIAGYAWLTGLSPATERAMVMALAILAMGLLAREPHRLAAVSLAALLLIVIDPTNATDIGFQLSLAAVLGIITLGLDLVALRTSLFVLSPWPLDRWLWKMVLFVTAAAIDGLAIGLAATLATAPLIAWHFGSANPWSPLTTLIAAPATSLALWCGLPTVILGGWFPDGPWAGLYSALEWSLDALVRSVAWGAALPGATIAVPAPSAWAVVAWPLLFIPLHDRAELVPRMMAVGALIAAWG